MRFLTLGDLRVASGLVQVECLRCGDIERRPLAGFTGPDAMAIGGIGLGLVCRACGAKACITTGVPGYRPANPEA